MENTYNFIAYHYNESPYKCKEYYNEYKQFFTNLKEMKKVARASAEKIRKAINYHCYIHVQVYKNGKYNGEYIIKR